MDNNKKDSLHKTNHISVHKNVDAQAQLLKELKEYVSKYSDYETPFIKSDGDIIIALKSLLRRRDKQLKALLRL